MVLYVNVCWQSSACMWKLFCYQIANKSKLFFEFTCLNVMLSCLPLVLMSIKSITPSFPLFVFYLKLFIFFSNYFTGHKHVWHGNIDIVLTETLDAQKAPAGKLKLHKGYLKQLKYININKMFYLYFRYYFCSTYVLLR